jgi:NTE family protein
MEKTTNSGLVLEAGGARGAYQIGVIKALMENGYRFNGFVGTSIGAINAAMLAQGDFDKALEFWANITMEDIFDLDAQLLLQFVDYKNIKPNIKLPFKITKALFKTIKNGGINTSKMRDLLERYIDEDKIRKSGNDFGLVTLSIYDSKPHKIIIE